MFQKYIMHLSRIILQFWKITNSHPSTLTHHSLIISFFLWTGRLYSCFFSKNTQNINFQTRVTFVPFYSFSLPRKIRAFFTTTAPLMVNERVSKKHRKRQRQRGRREMGGFKKTKERKRRKESIQGTEGRGKGKPQLLKPNGSKYLSLSL
uniref:Uncharacterized protein n=1 Tax=Cacopsylla melanoneura TaxID=428564 RepID=A0A8D9FFQ8_9HEMI